MTMKVTLSEFMGCEDWSKSELRKAIDDLAEDILERDKLISDMFHDYKKCYIPRPRGENVVCPDDCQHKVGFRMCGLNRSYMKRIAELGIEVE